MAAKNFLIIGYPLGSEPYLIYPTCKDQEHFSRKEAQRTADGHIQNRIIVKAKLVEVVQELNPASA